MGFAKFCHELTASCVLNRVGYETQRMQCCSLAAGKSAQSGRSTRSARDARACLLYSTARLTTHIGSISQARSMHVLTYKYVCPGTREVSGAPRYDLCVLHLSVGRFPCPCSCHAVFLYLLWWETDGGSEISRPPPTLKRPSSGKNSPWAWKQRTRCVIGHVLPQRCPSGSALSPRHRSVPIGVHERCWYEYLFCGQVLSSSCNTNHVR